jgi:hypothetical protein
MAGGAAQNGGSPGAPSEAAAGALLPVGGLAATGRPTPEPAGPGRVGVQSMHDLRRRRRELAERVAELTWDLGGLAYEMAIRDHYRLDVIARKAAELQQADAELDEVQRLLAGAESGIHGQCRSCGAVHSRGAAFCWHCGGSLLEEGRPAALGERP